MGPRDPLTSQGRRGGALWGMVTLAFTIPLLVLGQGLQVRLSGDELRVSAVSLQLIEGAVLERLRNGSTVPVALSLSVATDNRGTILRKVTERIVLSYDLWEEKYAATNPRKQSAPTLHRSAVGAESWCLDQLSMKSAELPDDTQLWFRVEVRAESSNEGDQQAAMSLRGLVDTFGKNRQTGPKRIVLEAGPLRMADLKNALPVRRQAALYSPGFPGTWMQ